MTMVYTAASMSLDGYIAGPDETGFEHLFRWYGNGDVSVPTSDPDLTLHMSTARADHFRDIAHRTGALVVGRGAPVGSGCGPAICQYRHMLSVGSVVLGVSNVPRAAAFWMQALGYVPREEMSDDWVVLVPAEGPGVQLALGLSETPVQERPRVHLDLYAGDAADQAAEVERLLSLGAQRVDWDLYPDDADFVVLADPEGNRFCVIDTSHG